MKFSFLILLLLSLNASAQKVDVLLIGTSHNYGNSPQQDISKIYQKIIDFKPSAFFGEFLSKEDEQNNMDYWCKEDNLKRLRILRKNRNIEEENLPTIIDSLKKRILIKPDDYRLKADLAHAYYLNQDVSNAHYQYWQVYTHLQKTSDQKLENYVNELLSPEMDNTGRSMKRLKTSEYALIAFPLMQQMNIKELIPMDCQDYDLNWSAAALAFYNKFESYKKDTLAIYAKELKEILNRREASFGKYFENDKNAKNLTEWLNTDEASVILASGDFYVPEIYQLKGFPKEEMYAKMHWWYMRNKGMCENIVKRSRISDNKKVVVIVGASHRKLMQDLLAEMPDVTVKNINEIK
jgi:hypothetical protein